MTSWMLSRSALLISVPIAVTAAALIYRLAMRLASTIRKAELLKVPLQEVSTLTFPEAGNVQMHLEGPRLTNTFQGLKYQIVGAGSAHKAGNSPTGASEDVQSLVITPSIGGVRSADIETARDSYGTVYVPAPGDYELRVGGLSNRQEGKKSERCRIVFTRPYTLAVTLCILGIVFMGLLFVGGTVLSCILLISPPGQ